MRRFAARRSSTSSAATAAAAFAISASFVVSLLFFFCFPSPSLAQSSVNGTHTIKGELNAAMNGLFSRNPTYLRSTRVSLEGTTKSTATATAANAVDCFKRCATTLENASASTSACYGATFTPATNACDLFYKTAAVPCPALVVAGATAPSAAVEAPSSVLFPWRYTRVAESCITTGPAFKDGPPFELPSPRVALDAGAGIAMDATVAAVFQGTTVFEAPLTTLNYIGSVAKVVSPAVCTGICKRLTNGTTWNETPTDFTNSWAAAEGYYGIPMGPVSSDCIMTSHYNAAASYGQTDDRFEYVCDLWGSPTATVPATVPLFDARPQEPGGRNSATVLLVKRWERLVRGA